MTRTLDTLIQQALMMQELDHAVNGNVMVKGWYADLSPGEQQLFDEWVTTPIKKVDYGEILTKLGHRIIEGLPGGLTKETGNLQVTLDT